MTAFLEPPSRPALHLRVGIAISEWITGKTMLPARILAWSWRTSLGSGALEAFTPHGRTAEEKRVLKLVRLAASLAVACPFCLDLNAAELAAHGVTSAELEALKRGDDLAGVASLNPAERLAVEYPRAISATPLAIPAALVRSLREVYEPERIVVIAAAAAQVNYWARLIQAFGIPPAGFSDNCPV